MVVCSDKSGWARSRAVQQQRAEAFRQIILPKIAEAQAEGATSLVEIANALNHHGVTARRGGKWTPTQVARVLKLA
jgi:hypothetical protein